MPRLLHRACERLITVLFLGSLLVPALGLWAGVGRADGAIENRELALPPAVAFTWNALRQLPDSFTRYFEDHFAFRQTLVRAQAAVRHSVLGVSPSPTVITGRDGWLFYGDDGSVEDFATGEPFTPGELEMWRRTLQHTYDWLRARGILYVFVIAPDKHHVYPEFMPASIRRQPRSRIDQLVAYLSQRSTVPVVDLRGALLSAKPKERVYHQTDTHWNDRGAYAAYAGIMQALSTHDRALRPLPRTAFDARDVRTPGWDLARMIALSDRLEEVDLRLVRHTPRARIIEPAHVEPHGIYDRLVTVADDPSLPRAVIFRDSFSTALVPFLAEHFSRALFLWQHNVEPTAIEQERPDVVIQQWVGRKLYVRTPYDPFEAGDGR